MSWALDAVAPWFSIQDVLVSMFIVALPLQIWAGSQFYVTAWKTGRHGGTDMNTLIALGTWCQVLVRSSRLDRITIEEAEELGRSLTASLLDVVTKRSGKK